MNFTNQEKLLTFNGENITAVLDRYESVTKQSLTQLAFMGRSDSSRLDDHFESNLNSYRLKMLDTCFTGEFKNEIESNEAIKDASNWQEAKSELLKMYAEDEYEKVLNDLQKLERSFSNGRIDIDKFIRKFEYQVSKLPKTKSNSSRIRGLFLKGLKNKYLDVALENGELDDDGLPNDLRTTIAVVKKLAKKERKKKELRQSARGRVKENFSSSDSDEESSDSSEDETESSEEEYINEYINEYKKIKNNKKNEKQKIKKKRKKKKSQKNLKKKKL